MIKKLETELKLRGFSEKTIRSYVFYNKKFLEFTKKDALDTDEDDIKTYLGHLISDKKHKASSVNLALSTLKFFYSKVLGKEEIFKNVYAPKLDKKIPTVLSKNEVKILLESATNIKHRLLLEMMYSSGLRVSETVKVKITDLDLDEKIGKVCKGKGSKDRMFIISSQIKVHIKDYIKTRKEKGIESEYLFYTNKNHSKHMSVRQAQKVIKVTSTKAGINKKIFCHALRSSFATHLLDSGVDIRVIQELLGHSNISTTQRYTKVSTQQIKKVKSPLDNL